MEEVRPPVPVRPIKLIPAVLNTGPLRFVVRFGNGSAMEEVVLVVKMILLVVVTLAEGEDVAAGEIQEQESGDVVGKGTAATEETARIES